jgi:hypothetical protein
VVRISVGGRVTIMEEIESGRNTGGEEGRNEVDI